MNSTQWRLLMLVTILSLVSKTDSGTPNNEIGTIRSIKFFDSMSFELTDNNQQLIQKFEINLKDPFDLRTQITHI